MSIEDLLKPRWKCIADYPDNTNEIGTILDRDWCRYKFDDEDAGEVLWRISDFPHLFKKLEWYENRKPEDMPEYIKDLTTGEVFAYDDNYKAHGTAWMGDHKIAPATQSDYEEYVKQSI